MDRRELLKMIAALTGGAVIGGEVFLTGCHNPDKVSDTFSPEDINLLDEIAETILPQTNTPGAKAAKVGEFMVLMVNDCYKKEDQQAFHAGIVKLNEACEKMHGHAFMKASPEQRKALLTALDKERGDYQKTKKPEQPTHYFQYMKQLTILGYFTSEQGRKSAQRYVPVPGKFQGVIDYKKGDKAFAGLG